MNASVQRYEVLMVHFRKGHRALRLLATCWDREEAWQILKWMKGTKELLYKKLFVREVHFPWVVKQKYGSAWYPVAGFQTKAEAIFWEATHGEGRIVRGPWFTHHGKEGTVNLYQTEEGMVYGVWKEKDKPPRTLGIFKFLSGRKWLKDLIGEAYSWVLKLCVKKAEEAGLVYLTVGQGKRFRIRARAAGKVSAAKDFADVLACLYAAEKKRAVTYLKQLSIREYMSGQHNFPAAVTCFQSKQTLWRSGCVPLEPWFDPQKYEEQMRDMIEKAARDRKEWEESPEYKAMEDCPF